jgi:hypothetical protein
MNLAILPALIAAAATASPATPPKEAVIPFVASQGVLDWQAAASDDALYVRGYDGRWYFVRTMGPCPRVRDALNLGFATSALGQLDRHGAILAQGSRCPVDSVTLAASPPPSKKKH